MNSRRGKKDRQIRFSGWINWCHIDASFDLTAAYFSSYQTWYQKQGNWEGRRNARLIFGNEMSTEMPSYDGFGIA